MEIGITQSIQTKKEDDLKWHCIVYFVTMPNPVQIPLVIEPGGIVPCGGDIGNRGLREFALTRLVNFIVFGQTNELSNIFFNIQSTYLITIKSPTGDFVKDKFGKTLSDGDISEAWIPLNALEGTYKITITISQQTDSIEFKLL